MFLFVILTFFLFVLIFLSGATCLFPFFPSLLFPVYSSLFLYSLLFLSFSFTWAHSLLLDMYVYTCLYADGVFFLLIFRKSYINAKKIKEGEVDDKFATGCSTTLETKKKKFGNRAAHIRVHRYCVHEFIKLLMIPLSSERVIRTGM